LRLSGQARKRQGHDGGQVEKAARGCHLSHLRNSHQKADEVDSGSDGSKLKRLFFYFLMR
jgi:hypothetical protein